MWCLPERRLRRLRIKADRQPRLMNEERKEFEC